MWNRNSYRGILVMKTGLSSKSQELTALFLVVRLVCGTIMEVDIYTLLDLITFLSTAWVIYMIRFKLQNTYSKSLDNFHLYYVVINLLFHLLNPFLLLFLFLYINWFDIHLLCEIRWCLLWFFHSSYFPTHTILTWFVCCGHLVFS